MASCASLLVLLLTPALSGCVVGTVAKTAVDVVTLPVKVVSAGRRAGDHQPVRSRREARPRNSQAEEATRPELRLTEERCRKGRPLPTDTAPLNRRAYFRFASRRPRRGSRREHRLVVEARGLWIAAVDEQPFVGRMRPAAATRTELACGMFSGAPVKITPGQLSGRSRRHGHRDFRRRQRRFARP